MKKNFLLPIFLLLLFCMTVLTGCIFQKTVKDLDRDQIVASSPYFPERMPAPSDIPSLAKNSEVIIYGEVLHTKSVMPLNKIPQTFEEVKILKFLKGNFEEGKCITVRKENGVINLKDHINSFPSKEKEDIERQKFSQYTDAELKDLYIEQTEPEDMILTPGDKVIYFLNKSSAKKYRKVYTPSYGPESEYFEMNENQFVQMPVWVSINNLSSSENEDLSEQFTYDVYTLDQITDFVQESLDSK